MSGETALNSDHKLMMQLTWAGAIPLVVALVFAWMQKSALPTTAFVSYSAVILAFMAGSFWGQVLLNASIKRSYWPVIIYCAGVALLIWAALMLIFSGSLAWSLVLLFIGHGINYFVEKRGLGDKQQSWYRVLRMRLSVIVCALHFILLLRLAG